MSVWFSKLMDPLPPSFAPRVKPYWIIIINNLQPSCLGSSIGYWVHWRPRAPAPNQSCKDHWLGYLAGLGRTHHEYTNWNHWSKWCVGILGWAGACTILSIPNWKFLDSNFDFRRQNYCGRLLPRTSYWNIGRSAGTSRWVARSLTYRARVTIF